MVGSPQADKEPGEVAVVEMNYREKNVKKTNTWRLNNTLLNNQEITEEIKEEIKK